MSVGTRRVTAYESVRQWFQQSVNRAAQQRRVDATPESLHYLVNLLTEFSRSDRLFHWDQDGPELRPLALMYKDSLEESNPAMRRLLLQRLGDTALFIAGVFADSLSRRLVDVDYYVAMGSNAYGSLSDNVNIRSAAGSLSDVFGELECKFVDFIDVVGEVCESMAGRSERDALRLYEIWLRTGSRRAAQRLRTLGIDPVGLTAPRFEH